jgi:hypothetical protein
MDDLKELPPLEKKVATKVLSNEGYSLRNIEEILGVDHVTAGRYAKLETPQELEQFETKLTNVFRQTEHRVAAKALKRIEERIDYSRINEALDVYRELRVKGVSLSDNVKRRIVAEEFFQ